MRFARDETAPTTFALLAECFEEGGVPAKVLADRMGCLKAATVWTALVLMIARFAQRLDLTPTADVIPRPVGMVVNRPVGGAPFQVSAR